MTELAPKKLTRSYFVVFALALVLYTITYARQIADVRNDVKVISRHGDYKNPIDFVTVQMLDKLLAEGAVYVVSSQEGCCPKFILDNKKYRFVESGPIHRKRGWL